VFTHADFSRNRTIYLTVIVVGLLYLLFMIYARWSDGKDLLKVKKDFFRRLSNNRTIVVGCDTVD
jgi:hypothetical protein